jgi:hypothetical protein
MLLRFIFVIALAACGSSKQTQQANEPRTNMQPGASDVRHGSGNAHDATGTTQWSGTYGPPVYTDAGTR